MINALKRQIRWLVFGSKINPWKRWHPLGQLVHWYSTRQINDYLYQGLDRHLSRLQDRSSVPTKSIVSLALKTCLAKYNTKKRVDDTFKMFAISQIKLFLFSGHDTTSSTICYIFYLLATNPLVLEQIPEEHVKVFGSVPAERRLKGAISS